MVCSDCEKRLGTVIVQDKWKDGARNTQQSGGKVVASNTLLGNKASMARFAPYQTRCKLCRGKVHQQHSQYCQQCSYKGGICSMCGKKIIDVTMYKQSSA